MKPFMNEDFLLTTPTARHLYHDFVATLPIVDYHCHLSAREIAEDHRFRSITEAWLGGDHYKWRVMRACGIDEKYITGDADDWEKFEKWAQVVPQLIGNPLYHWTHLELQRYFGIHTLLSPKTARQIFDACNEKLRQPGMTVRGMLEMNRVRCLCTTDDPADDLAWHRAIAEDASFTVRVLPGWRPDQAMNVEAPGFAAYVEKLARVSGVAIRDFSSLCEALRRRLDLFTERGCRVSDHGIGRIPFCPMTEADCTAVMGKALAGETVTQQEAEGFRTELFRFLGKEYVRRDWVMQLHYGALRNNNDRMMARLGKDTGYDAIGEGGCATELAGLLNLLHEEDALAKTVVYSLNPNDNDMISSVLGCFWEKGIAGKMQLGAAWWFNDTIPGMTNQLVSFASTAVLGNFIGMLTDSRSFLSYARHEYFRRILADLLGRWVENGEYPEDEEALAAIMEGVSYRNAVRFLGLEEKA